MLSFIFSLFKRRSVNIMADEILDELRGEGYVVVLPDMKRDGISNYIVLEDDY